MTYPTSLTKSLQAVCLLGALATFTLQAGAAAPAGAQAPAGAPATSAGKAPSSQWKDVIPFTLAPGQGIEIKMQMKQGSKATYDWTVEGGTVNYDRHGDGAGKSISYEKGRSVSADDGEIEAAFDGNHGWFWRNRGTVEVKGVLRLRGDYSNPKRVL